MKTSRKELARSIAKLAENQSDTRRLAQAAAAYLIEHRQTRELDSIMRDVEQLRFDEHGILEVSATSATPLTAENKQAIKNLFEAEQLIIHEQQDKKLLGGVRVRALEKSVDFSVQARLQRLRSGL